MPQLGTADVTYTKLEGNMRGSPSVPEREYQFTLLFPNGTNVLYTSGGIPLSNGQLGCPGFLTKFILEDDASSVGAVYKWDQKANTIRIYLTQNTTGASTTTSLIEMTTAATVSSTTLRAIAQGW
jgi:hypothetical protein